MGGTIRRVRIWSRRTRRVLTRVFPRCISRCDTQHLVHHSSFTTTSGSVIPRDKLIVPPFAHLILHLLMQSKHTRTYPQNSPSTFKQETNDIMTRSISATLCFHLIYRRWFGVTFSYVSFKRPLSDSWHLSATTLAPVNGFTFCILGNLSLLKA